MIPNKESTQRASRLPRRVTQNLTVAELVKKYQDFLPAQGVHDLAQTAFAPRPPVSESEQEYPSQLTLRPGIRSNKSRHHIPVRKISTSDFEQGYAANVAPRYLRRTVNEGNKTRIPVPIGSFESHESSRRPSPEKRFSGARDRDARPGRPSSPPGNKLTRLGGKNRVTSRSKDKLPTRPPLTTGNKSLRRPPTGTKVPNIAKHFERLSREAERSRSRYTVIRGKRARPVASARAKVQVLESLKDAIGDDSESSDSSSEADYEGEDEGNEEERPLDPAIEKPSPESEHISSEPTSEAVSSADPFPIINLNPPDTDNHDAEDIAHVSPPEQIHSPPSPFLSTVKAKNNDATLTPPASDQEVGGNAAERISILKALSGFWPLPARHPIEGDDPTSDPEHIFRDSSMVVRIDEPTSIIALALKCVLYYYQQSHC